MRYPVFAEKLIDGQPYGDSAFVANGFLRVGKHFPKEPQAVFERTAIFVGAMVVALQQEVLEKRQIVACIDIDDVETDFPCQQRRLAVPAAEVRDVRLVHGAGLQGVVAVHHGMRGRQRGNAAVAVVGVQPVMDEFDRGEASMGMDGVHRQPERRHAGLVPQPRLVGGRDVGGRVDFRLLGGDHAPSALGLDAAKRGFRIRVAVPHAGAVRHLVEAVGRGDRADPDRLEQDVVSGVPHGLMPFPKAAGNPAYRKCGAISSVKRVIWSLTSSCGFRP